MFGGGKKNEEKESLDHVKPRDGKLRTDVTGVNYGTLEKISSQQSGEFPPASSSSFLVPSAHARGSHCHSNYGRFLFPLPRTLSNLTPLSSHDRESLQSHVFPSKNRRGASADTPHRVATARKAIAMPLPWTMPAVRISGMKSRS